MTDINELLDRVAGLTRYVGLAHCSGYKCRLPHCDSCTYEPEDIEPVLRDFDAALSTLRSEVEGLQALHTHESRHAEGLLARINELEEQLRRATADAASFSDLRARIKELEAERDESLSEGATIGYMQAAHDAQARLSTYEKALREIEDGWHGDQPHEFYEEGCPACFAHRALTGERRICADCGAEEGAAYPPDTEEGRHRDHHFVPMMHGKLTFDPALTPEEEK